MKLNADSSPTQSTIGKVSSRLNEIKTSNYPCINARTGPDYYPSDARLFEMLGVAVQEHRILSFNHLKKNLGFLLGCERFCIIIFSF